MRERESLSKRKRKRDTLLKGQLDLWLPLAVNQSAFL